MLPENGKQNLNSTVDLYWQPALNAKYYSLYLWEQGTTMPTTPYYSYIYGTSTWLYNLAPGKTFNWKLVSVNECSTAESDMQSFSVRPIPDLTVTDVQMPASVESGSSFTLTFTVKNIGQTTTGSSLWTDAVYMSTDSTGNSGMNYMVAKYNMGPLAVNGTYTQSYPVSVPAEYSGKYYLWVRADNSGSVTELSENNNQLRAINPITVELKPFPDILVKDIAASATATPGDSLQITWKVGNIGNAAALGGWTERISMVSNSGLRAYLNPTYITVTRDLAVVRAARPVGAVAATRPSGAAPTRLPSPILGGIRICPVAPQPASRPLAGATKRASRSGQGRSPGSRASPEPSTTCSSRPKSAARCRCRSGWCGSGASR